MPEQRRLADERRKYRESRFTLQGNGNPAIVLFRTAMRGLDEIDDLFYPPIVVPSYSAVLAIAALQQTVPLVMAVGLLTGFEYISRHWTW